MENWRMAEPKMSRGTRVRFTPDTKGKGTDMDTKAQYAWGVAREIAPLAPASKT